MTEKYVNVKIQLCCVAELHTFQEWIDRNMNPLASKTAFIYVFDQCSSAFIVCIDIKLYCMY